MKWLKEILLVLVKKVTAKQAFILLTVGIILFAGYKIFDRYFDYREAVDLNRPKRIIERDTSYKEMNIKYADITNFDTDRKTGRAAK